MKRLAGAVAFFAAALPLAAGAQALGANSAAPAQAIDEGLRRQEERTQELQRRLQPKADVLGPQAMPSVSTRLPAEQPCFIITEVELRSPDLARFAWLNDAALPYLQQCAGVAGLRQIAAALDAKLIELGYVTSRVALPRQNLQNGALTIDLHVGRIADIGMFDSDDANMPDSAWGTWRNAFPASAGDVLNVRDLEQGIEQMKRLPSQMVAIKLEPGPQPDSSSVRIVHRPASWADRLRGCLTLDNSGSETLGRPQLSGCLALDNPLGLNDIVSVSANSNAEHPDSGHRSQSLSFNYSIPWGYNSFSFNLSKNRYAQQVQATTARFLSSGTSENAELKWQRTMLRTSSVKAGLYAAVATRRANSYLDDVELIVQRRRNASLETGISYKQLLGEASLEFELGYRHGVPWLNAQDDLPSAAAGGPTLAAPRAGRNAAWSVPTRAI